MLFWSDLESLFEFSFRFKYLDNCFLFCVLSCGSVCEKFFWIVLIVIGVFVEENEVGLWYNCWFCCFKVFINVLLILFGILKGCLCLGGVVVLLFFGDFIVIFLGILNFVKIDCFFVLLILIKNDFLLRLYFWIKNILFCVIWSYLRLVFMLVGEVVWEFIKDEFVIGFVFVRINGEFVICVFWLSFLSDIGDWCILFVLFI